MKLHEIEKYIDYLFGVALKKCGSIEDAEDLTQEVLLAAIRQVSDSNNIANVKAWLSSTLNHKFYDALRRKYKLPTISIDLIPEINEPFLFEDIFDDKPDEIQIRREVAYLAGLYREVIIRYYLHGDSVQKIANELKIPKGTVLSRLSSGREQMKKGFDEMENYEKQSYQPERLDLSCHGRPGLHDEPWSLISKDMMKQNILITAYEKPLTCVEIARGLGIPTAYIEKSIDELVESQLMERKGNRVYTDFMITTPEQILSVLDQQIDFADKYYSMIWSQISNSLDELQHFSWFDNLPETQKNKCRYYFLLHIFTQALYTSTCRIIPVKEVYPNRPDGGSWIAIGSRYPLDFDFENYRFGKYCYGGERRAYWKRFMHSKVIDFHVYDTQPDLNKYERGPVEMHDDNLCKLLYIINENISFDETGFNPMFLQNIPHLAKYGILQIVNDKPVVDIPILTLEQYEEMDKLRIKKMHELADKLTDPLSIELPNLKLQIPKHLEGRVAEYRQYACYAIPMATLKIAIANGDFMKDITYPCPPMVMVIIK
ncbi:MAG: polymerase sigma factor, sigma-70 family [Haloplasmataceae bacterium]|jgi:RNA polymerase sigma-70 factor (ECF subfamily)|nr:polymerase sigma factor, sigma-70 family [Haloplasmataceae bacterium]